MTYSYPIEHGPSGGSEFGKASSPRKLLIVARISMTAQEVLGGPPKNTRISNTVLASGKDSKIVETILKIESDTGQRARKQCSENRRVRGRDRPSAGAPTLARLLESR